MDPATLAATAVAALIPPLMKGAGELAAGALKDLYQAVRDRLSLSGHAAKLEAIEKDPINHKAELEQLAIAILQQDVSLRSRVEAHLSTQQQQTNAGPLVNTVNSEKSVVAGQIVNLNM